MGTGLASTQIQYEGSIGKASGFHPVISARIGYDYEITDHLLAGVFLETTYRPQSITIDLGNGQKSYSNIALIFQPAFLIGYRF